MKNYRWANPEKNGVIYESGDHTVYLDSGPEFEMAIATGPGGYAGAIKSVELPSRAGVDAERDRRRDSGFFFAGKQFQSDQTSLMYISGAAQTALISTANGKAMDDVYWNEKPEPFAWIAADNSLTIMDPQTVLAFGLRASEWVGEHIKAARALKDLPKIPADYFEDVYWPSIQSSAP